MIAVLGLDSAAAIQERFRVVELDVSICMKAEGFDYVPKDPERVGLAGSDGYVDPTTRAWVEVYGFGISTMEFDQYRLGDGLVGVTERQGDEPEDLNAAHVATLSGPEKAAYNEALLGEGGCQARAVGSLQAVVDYLAPHLEAIDDQVLADPRWLELEAQLPMCLDEAGRDSTTWEQARRDAEDRLDSFKAIYSSELADDIGQFDDNMKNDLSHLQSREIGTAVALYDCGASRYSPQVELVRHEYEQAFLDEYGDQIASIRAQG